MSNEPENSAGEPQDPIAELLRMLGAQQLSPEALEQIKASGMMPPDLQNMLANLKETMSSLGANNGDTVDWKHAREQAVKTAATGAEVLSEQDRKDSDQALQLAQLWLDKVVELESVNVVGAAWSRQEWVEKTMDAWQQMTGPVASAITAAMNQVVSDNVPTEMEAGFSQAFNMFSAMSGRIFGAQVGEAIGVFSREVFSSTDIGVPLVPDSMAIVPQNIAEFAQGLSLEKDEVRLFLAVREAAHARLFHNVPWLRSHLLSSIERFSRGIHIDLSKIEEAASEINPENIEQLQDTLSSGAFQPEVTEDQQEALKSLETSLALVEGWVDVISAEAAASLPNLPALRESIRRRRASGGPAERAFAQLVGLELRPRRLREAAALWTTLGEELGVAGRDAIWQHPDLMPTEADLDDPSGYTKRRELEAASSKDMDEALAQLLGEDPAQENPEQPEK